MPDKAKKLAGDIRARMEETNEWERVPTSIPGIFLVHMPGKELRVMLMFNPTDEEGNPLKRKGFYFSDAGTAKAARAAFADDRLEDLVAAVWLVNGPQARQPGERRDVLEV